MGRAEERRDMIRDHVKQGIGNFRVETDKHIVEIRDFDDASKVYSPSQQKQALLEGKTLVEPLRGTVVLKDRKTGKILDKKKQTLAQIPYFTERHTFVMKGTDYNVSNQVRIKPGVYTRRRANGQLESAFNLARGRNFRLSMDPQRGVFFMEYGTTKIPLYGALHAMGVRDTEFTKYWGKSVLDLNRKFSAGKEAKYVKVLYGKLIPAFAQSLNPSHDEMLKAVRDSYAQTKMDPEVTQITLGGKYDKVEPRALLRASQKILNVFNEKEKADDRDSTAFKTIHTVESFLKERVEKHASPDVSRKVKMRLRKAGDDPKISDIMPSSPFTKSIHSFVTTSALTATPMQINPMEIIDHSVKVTSLGEGGISSTLAVPDEARDVHHSHLGILDPVRTPESGKAGIDVRASMFAKRDDDGNMYAQMRNTNTDRLEYVKASKLVSKTIAFPNQSLKGRKKIDVLRDGEVCSVSPGEADYQVPDAFRMYSPTTNLVPFINSAQGNRNIMGAKMHTQALPLIHRDVPHVQIRSWNPKKTVERQMGELIVPMAPVAGTVEKIDKDYIYVRADRAKRGGEGPQEEEAAVSEWVKTAAAKPGELYKVPYATNFPLMSKTYMHDDVSVKKGQRVRAGQTLADTNFTKDGTLALGKNLSVGYMPYYGFNSNDAVVISEGAARKLTSRHMYKEKLMVDPTTITDKDKHRAYFGSKYSRPEYDRLDAKGVIRRGQKVSHGDLIIAAMRKDQASAQAQMLGQLHKSLVKPYRDAAVTWDHDHQGTVVDVAHTGRQVVVTLKMDAPMGIGDKLAGRYGNKGVVSKIVPDAKMVKDEAGNPIDVLMTSAGVITRINPSQILETAVGKVAEKTGKPIVIDQFADHDNVKWAKKLLKDNGIKDKETVFDPVSGKKISGIHVGRQYTYKLFKSTDTNYAARGIGPGYDSNLQPTKGGHDGAKSLGKMEFNALLAHDARSILKEATTVKGERNDEYWRRVQLGLPTPTPSSNFAYDKFTHMLHGAGIKVNKKGSRIGLAPLTDRDIDRMAQSTVKNGLLVTPRKIQGVTQIVPEKGGLFDPAMTGGLSGTKYSKIDLAEPVVNPVFADPARRLLGMSTKEFTGVRDDRGAKEIKKRLNALDLASERRKLKLSLKKLQGSQLDDAVKRIKYIDALNKEGLKAGDAYVLSKVPVVPPAVRPIMPTAEGTMLVADSNYLYRDVMLANEVITDTPDELKTVAEQKEHRRHLHDSVGALFGFNDPVSPQNQGRGTKGHLRQITGTGSPKYGYFQSRLLRKRQDLSGRATIVPDLTLEMDQVGLPEDMAWKMYEPFIVKGLVQSGHRAADARTKVKKRDPSARRVLDTEVMKRPVIMNRAPTLHRFGLVSAFPKLIPGKTVRLNPFAEQGMNADYDGDTVQLHVPVGDAAVAEAKGLTLSNLLLGDVSKDDLMVFPAHEALIGTYLATRKSAQGETKTFGTKAEAVAAYKRGEIQMNTPVNIQRR
jgi:DNA-directed RNA polymerase beta subunit